MVQSEHPLKVWEPGAETSTDDRFKAAMIMNNFDVEENPPQAHIMEIPLPSLGGQAARIREVYDNLTIYKHNPVAANVTPKYTLVDIHHDPGYTIVTLFGKPKLILIWPPTKENLRVFRGQYGQGNRFLGCHKQLNGGVFVVLRNGQTLLLPPYNLHLTFSLGGSIMCGYEVEAIEFFPVMISCLQMEIEYIDNQYLNENDRFREHGLNLKRLLKGLENTLLRRGNDEIKAKVIMAWITNMSTIKEAFQKAEGYEDRACAIWEEYLKDTEITQCPSCTADSRPFGLHMMSQHVAIIQPQQLRTGSI